MSRTARASKYPGLTDAGPGWFLAETTLPRKPPFCGTATSSARPDPERGSWAVLGHPALEALPARALAEASAWSFLLLARPGKRAVVTTADRWEPMGVVMCCG